MITHVRTAGVAVSDEDRAIDFSVNKLRFEKRVDVPMGEGYYWIEVAPQRAQTVVILTRGYAGSEERLGKFAHIVFKADDIDATYETLRSRGVEFTEPPTAQPWGRKPALFVDQDGNTFVLVSEEL
jgi:predicted enzyme related to lactoylglutathione lyase